MQGKQKLTIAVILVVVGIIALTYLSSWRGQVINFSFDDTQKITISKAGFEDYPFQIIDKSFIKDIQKRLELRPFYNISFKDLDPENAEYQITFDFGPKKKPAVLYYWKKESFISYNGKNYVPYKDFVNLLEQKLILLDKKISPAKVTGTDYSDDEKLIFALINVERKNAKVKPLKAEWKLTQLARMKSQDMINLDYLGHTSPTFGTYNDMLTATGTSFVYAGENIVSANTPQGSFELIMKDKSQRDLILNSNFTSFGVGVVPGGKHGYVLCILFIAQ